MGIDVMETNKLAPKIAPTEKLSKWFFESLGDFFSSIKEKFTAAVDNVKKLFWLELNVLKNDVQKTQQKEYGLDKMSQNDFDSLLLYLSHQQGWAWIKQILRYVETGARPGKNIYHNMANNVHIATYNKQFGTRCATLADVEKIITPRTFLVYWQKLYVEKQKKYANRKDFDRYITPLSKKYNVNPDTVRTFIGIESDFVPTAWIWKTYVWLMQISPEIATSYGFSPNDRLNPAKNIEMGIRYMVDNKGAILASQKTKTYAVLKQAKPQSNEKNLA